MIYVYSRMNSESRTHLQNWVQDGSLLFPSLAHMMDQLTNIFGDPHRARDAASRLHSNAQKNKSFGTWIAEIRRDAAIAGYESNSRYLRDLIFNKLSLELKKAMIHERDIEYLDFDEAASRLQDIENRLRSCANAEFRPSFRSGVSNQPIAYPEPAVHPISSRASGDPMDLSATMPQKKGNLSQDERERRRRLGLCYYCGEIGHRSFECPKKTQPVVQARVMEMDEIEDNKLLSGKD